MHLRPIIPWPSCAVRPAAHRAAGSGPDRRAPKVRRAGHFLAATALAFLLITGRAGPARGDFCGYTTVGAVQVWRGDRLQAEFRVALAVTPRQRSQGLMACERLPSGEGLLFTYPVAGLHAYWMKDTPVALAIVFIGDDGRIVNIGHGIPYDRSPIPSGAPARFVLEVNHAEGRNLQTGDRVVIQPPPQRPKEDTAP